MTTDHPPRGDAEPMAGRGFTRRHALYAAAIATLVTGLAALFNPLLASRLFGLEVVDPRGISQVRATFGGLYLALGGTLLWGAASLGRGVARGQLWTCAVLVGAVVAGRSVSIVVDGVLTPLNLAFLVTETGVALAAALAASSAPGRA